MIKLTINQLSYLTTTNRYICIIAAEYKTMFHLVELCLRHSLPNDFLDEFINILKNTEKENNVLPSKLPSSKMFNTYLKKKFPSTPTDIYKHVIEFPLTKQDINHRRQKRISVNIIRYDFICSTSGFAIRSINFFG